jgi:hypothetical protein
MGYSAAGDAAIAPGLNDLILRHFVEFPTLGVGIGH